MVSVVRTDTIKVAVRNLEQCGTSLILVGRTHPTVYPITVFPRRLPHRQIAQSLPYQGDDFEFSCYPVHE